MISLFIFKSEIRGMKYGMGTYVNQLINALQKYSNISIYLVTSHSNKQKEYCLIARNNNLTEIYIPTISKRFNYKLKFEEKYSTRTIDLLAEIISNKKKVIFLVNYIDALFICRQLKTRFPFPIVSVIHSAQWQLLFNGNYKKYIDAWESSHKIIDINNEKELYELSDKIISVTKYMKDYIEEFYQIEKSKVSLVRNGIDITNLYIPEKAEKRQLKQKLGFKADEKIILFAGRLDECKGGRFLFDAFKIVTEEYPNVRLLIAGEDGKVGNFSKFLEQCTNIWGKITFTGFISNENMLKIYQIADIGVIPSIYDHCPYVALEMIGHRIPLIISNTNGLNEILDKNQCIYLSPQIEENGEITFNIEEFADAILCLINDEAKAFELTSNYSLLVNSIFSAKRMANDTLDILSCFYT